MKSNSKLNPVLYIDDEQENLDGFKYTFRKEYQVFTAKTVDESWQIIRNNNIKIVLADQRMPDMTGIEFFGQLASKYPDIIRIIITAFAYVDIILDAINKGQVYRFITKPWNKYELKVLIDNAIEAYDLKNQNQQLIENLQKANSELNLLNNKLLKEIDEREKAEKQLAQHRDNLELLVKERTEEAERINEELTATNQEMLSTNEELNSANEELEIINIALEKEINIRKQIQKNLEESESKFRNFIDQSFDGIVLLNHKGIIIEWNKKMEEIIGLAKEKAINSNIIDIDCQTLPESDRISGNYRKIREEIQNYLKNIDNEKVLTLEGYRQITTGESKYIHTIFFPVVIQNQKYVGRIFRDLTNQKQAEEELKLYKEHLEELVKERTEQLNESEQRLRTLSNNLPGGAIYTGYTDNNDIDHLLYASARIEDITGVSIEDLKKDMSRFFNRIHRDNLPIFLNTRAQSQKSLELLDQEIQYQYSENKILWLHLRIMYKKGNDGNIWWDGYVIDITWRKLAEKAALDKENIIKNIQAGIASKTGEKLFETIILKLSETLKADYTYIAELVNEKLYYIKTISRLSNKAIVKNIEYPLTGTLCQEVLKKGICSYPAQVAQYFPDDKMLYNMQVEGYVGITLLNSHNEPIGIMVAMYKKPIEDTQYAEQILQIFSTRVSAEMERIKAEQLVKENEQKILNIFNSSSDAIIISDFNRKFLDVNETFLKLTGYEKNELQNIKTIEIFLPEYLLLLNDRMDKLKRGTKLSNIEIELRTKDDVVIPIELNSKLIVHGGYPALLTIIRDITERKQIEKRMLETMIQTEEKEREKFAGNLHDEVGPLLSSLKMYISLLVETGDKNKRTFIISQIQTLIKESITAVREISNDLSPHVLNTYGCITAINSFISLKNDIIHINFSQNINEKRFPVNIEVIIYRIVKELITNTIKHAQSKKIDLYLHEEKNKLLLKYADDGIGFNFDEIINEKRVGIGLLNILSRLKTVNGKYKIETATGKGFSFELVIPVKQ
jgi:PAS domain S-box-containing protein